MGAARNPRPCRAGSRSPPPYARPPRRPPGCPRGSGSAGRPSSRWSLLAPIGSSLRRADQLSEQLEPVRSILDALALCSPDQLLEQRIPVAVQQREACLGSDFPSCIVERVVQPRDDPVLGHTVGEPEEQVALVPSPPRLTQTPRDQAALQRMPRWERGVP